MDNYKKGREIDRKGEIEPSVRGAEGRQKTRGK
jgi:hypothetical protein